MNLRKADTLVERGARALEGFARDFATENGVKQKLADELMDDAAFLRRLKPSLIVARARGEAPKDEPPGQTTAAALAPPPPAPKPEPEPARRERPAKQGGPNPFVVVGIAFAAGVVLAKLIDWRGHAHPRR
jgi:hypothetical protein